MQNFCKIYKRREHDDTKTDISHHENGYDRFAVDDVMEQYAAQVAFLQRKLELYQEQMVVDNGEVGGLTDTLQ